jgi:hypothetical protein
MRRPSMRRSRPLVRLSAALAVAASLTCENPFAPPRGVPFTPPSWYRALYEHDVGCSDKTRRFEELRWYWIPGGGFSYDGQRDAGLTESSAGQIFIAESFLANPVVVRHEMLHAILRKTNGHPHEFFYVRCPLMWSNYYGPANARARWVDDSILLQYEDTHGGQLDVPGQQ